MPSTRAKKQKKEPEVPVDPQATADAAKTANAVMKRERGRPVELAAISWPTTDKEFIPWTLCTANADGSITIFGGSVNRDNLRNKETRKGRPHAKHKVFRSHGINRYELQIRDAS